MSTLQRLSALALLLAALVMGLWTYKGLTKGFKLATPEQILVEERSTDEFGDEVVKTTLVDNPDKLDIGLDLAGPISGALGGLAVVMFLVDRKRRA